MPRLALAAAIVASILPLSAAALIVETVELDSVTLDSYGWYASRLFTFDDPATPDGDVFFRGIATVTLDDWTHLSLSLTTWDAVHHDLIGGVIALARSDETGLVLESRALGETPVGPLVQRIGPRTIELNSFSGACCGHGVMVLIASGDGAVDSVRFATRGNPFVRFEASTSGTESFSFVNDDFDAVVHAGVLAAQASSEARAMLSGRAVVEGEIGEFIGAMVGFSDLGDAPDWCHLRMLGPQLEVESEGADANDVCSLIAHGRAPGRYEMRVERFLAPNVDSDARADVLAHGAFVRFP